MILKLTKMNTTPISRCKSGAIRNQKYWQEYLSDKAFD